jgi:tetratricopeptide (TPR) repeat protein
MLREGADAVVSCLAIVRCLFMACLLEASTAPVMAQAQGSGTDRVDRLHAEAKAAEARGDIAAAIASYESILKLAPRLAAAYNNLGALYFRQGEYRRAIDVLQRGLAIDPAMSSASALLGISLYEMADYSAARAPLEKALGANPNDVHAARVLAHDLIKLGEWEAALSPLLQLARRDPKDQEIWYLLGTAHMELSKQALVKMREIDPESALVHQVSGEVMESMKNYDGALVEYKKSVEMAPDRRGAHYKLGNLYWTTSQWDAATREFQAELSLDPNHCASQWKLGNILLEQNLSPDLALADIDKALAICPGLTQARLDRGRACLKLGRHEEAIRDLQLAAQQNADEPNAHFFLAQAYREAGRPQDAAAEMKIFSALEEQKRSDTAKRAEDVLRAKENPQ